MRNLFYKVLPMTGTVIYLLFIFGTNLFHLNYAMNSDIAAEVLLGYESWKNKEWILHTWFPSTETRVVSTANLAALLNGLTHDMILAMGISCCLMAIAILGSVYFFLRSLDMQKYQWWMGFMILMMPCRFDSLQILYLFAGYYAIHVVILFITLGIYAGSLHKRKCRLPEMLIGVIPAVLLGAQGVRGLLVLYGPLFGMEMIRNLYLVYSGRRPDKNDRILSGWVAGILLACFVGMKLPFSTGQGLSRNIRKGFLKLFTVVIPDMGRAMGISDPPCGWMGKICLILILILAMYELAKILLRMCRRQEIEAVYWAYLILASSPLITALVVSFTTAESSERYYFILLFVMAFAVLLMWKDCRIKWQAAFSVVPALLAVLNAFAVYRPILTSKEPPETESYAVVELLAKNGIEAACATFENADSMTVLSNGRVKVRPVASVAKMDVCKWLSNADWYPPHVPYEQTTAYIITDSEMGEFSNFREKRAEAFRELEQVGKFHIFVADYNFSTLEE